MSEPSNGPQDEHSSPDSVVQTTPSRLRRLTPRQRVIGAGVALSLVILLGAAQSASPSYGGGSGNGSGGRRVHPGCEGFLMNTARLGMIANSADSDSGTQLRTYGGAAEPVERHLGTGSTTEMIKDAQRQIFEAVTVYRFSADEAVALAWEFVDRLCATESVAVDIENQYR